MIPRLESGRIVLVGTGTGIGKTHLGVALVKALADTGAEVAGLKPVESGVVAGEPCDASRLSAVSTFHVKLPPPYALAAPVSPHIAAAREGMLISLPPILRWVESVAAPWVVVETAGALLSPLAPGLTNLDLMLALEPTAVVLVAPDRLGVLHDVSAALLALRVLAPHVPEPVVALQTPGETDASTGSNAAELVHLGIARRVTTFPRADAEGADVQAVALGLVEALGRGNGAD